MSEDEGVEKVRAALLGSADTYADGDFNLTIYYEDLDSVAKQIFRAVWGRECTCGIPQYGPGQEHHRECPRWQLDVRPADDPAPEIVCDGRNCGGVPHE